ncbi:MAG TPA: Gfo/Idh/MocA family oxidoreductase [Bacteroidales bacterium]|nr:Gfo/Idh/MocA family oxidoreductase [Bacteroidales bacterium]
MKKAAIVGFGFMGMTHAKSILKMNDLKLSSIVERDLSIIDKNLQAEIGNIAVGNLNASDLSSVSRYSDFDECLNKEDFDAVIICTHVNTHYELTKKALLNNKDVFLEKPFCIDSTEAKELIDLASEKNKLLMIGHVVRFMSPYQKLKNWVDTREFGDLRFLSLTRFCGLPGWGQWKEKDVKDLSGGALFDLVIHDIDFAVSLLGQPEEIESVYLPGVYSKHDYVSALWSYDTIKTHIKIDGGFSFHKNFPFQAGYMAQFENASVAFSTLNGSVISIADDESVREVPAGDAGAGYYNEMLYFADCLNSGAVPELCTPDSSLLSIELCYKHL